MTKSPNDLIETVGDVSQRAEHEKTRARVSAISAVRALEHDLVRRLDGVSLRGLRNLATGEGPFFYAARVRGHTDSKLLWPDEDNAEAMTLVLMPRGQLHMAICRTEDDGYIDPLVTSKSATDDELYAEDLQAFLNTLAEVIPRHIEYSDRATKRYALMHELSEKVLQLLADTE
jgi:hypothetical protein